MKTNKKVSVAILTLALTSCCVAGFAFAKPVTASAESTVFEMAGASVRLAEKTGIRFRAVLGTEYSTEKDYFMMIFPEDYLTTYSLTAESDFYDELVVKEGLTIATMEALPYEEDGNWYVNGSLTTVLYENTNRAFFAVAYSTDGEGNRTYADVTGGKNVRSIVDVASMALNDTEAGYTADQIAVLNGMINDGYTQAQGKEKGAETLGTLTLDKANATLLVGQYANVKVNGLPAGFNVDVQWSVADNTVATVANGKVTAVKKGTTTVTAKVLGQTLELPVTVGDYSDVNYDFSTTTDFDAYAVNAYGNGAVLGIVADANAKDGYALKATKDNGTGGIKIPFTGINVEDYSSIKLRIRKESGNNLYVNANGTFVNACTTASYVEIDVIPALKGAGATTLNEILIKNDFGSSANGAGVFYIDQIEFTENVFEDMNDVLSFSEKNVGKDYPVVSGKASASVVATDGATDGYALKLEYSSFGWATDTAIVFPEPITQSLVSQYDHVYVRVKSVGADTSAGDRLYINNAANHDGALNATSGAMITKTDSTWVVLDLMPQLKSYGWAKTSLTHLVFIKLAKAGTFYVDYIEFVKDEPVDYNFSNAGDSDVNACASYNGGTVSGIVADANATDGFALKGVTSLNTSASSGITINFDDIDLSQYASVILRVRTTNSVSVLVNETSIAFANYANYTEIDLKAIMASESLGSTLSSVQICRKSVGNIEIYVDSVTFVEAE